MKNINKLSNIIKTTDGPFLTVIVPNPLTVSDLSKAKLKMKDVAMQAEEKLRHAYPTINVDDYMKQLRPYTDDPNQWDDVKSRACAIIVGPDRVTVEDLNHEVNQSSVTVSEHPNWLKLAQNTVEQTHLILALNYDSYRLFQASSSHIEELELASDAPGTLPETLGTNELKGGQLNFNSYDGGVSFHGHNEKSQEVKNDQRNYYQAISTYLREHFPLEKTEVVLYALPQNAAVLREALNYDSAISELFEPSSPAKLSMNEISERIATIIQDGIEANINQLHSDYERFTNLGQTTDDLSQLIDCARNGQIETLIICENTSSPGYLTRSELDTSSEFAKKTIISITI